MKKYKNKRDNKATLIIFLLLIVTFIGMSIGYAAYGQNINIGGKVVLKKPGKLEITRIDLVSSSNVKSSVTPTFDEDNATFNIVFGGRDSKYEAVYEVEIVNNSPYDYIYSDFNYNPTVKGSNDNAIGNLVMTTTGIQNGDVIKKEQTKIIRITLNLEVNDKNATYDVSIDTNVDTTTDKSGRIIMSVSPQTGDLKQPKKLTKFTANVINTYTYKKNFNISSSNSNFIVCDENGNSLSTLVINENETKSYEFYLKENPSAIFTTTSETTDIILKSNGSSDYNAGTVTISVDRHEDKDEIIPTVGNVTISQSDTVGAIDVTWDRIDSGGTSITGYTLMLYDSSNNIVKTEKTTNANTSYQFTNVDEGEYHVVLYGADAAGNTGKDYVSSATEENGYASSSQKIKTKWNYSVTTNLSGLKLTGEETAIYHQQYTAQLSTTGRYNRLPSRIYVYMGGKLIASGTDYSYSSSTGRITIKSVTDDIEIEAEASGGICLVEGTKILLANGKQKNIENITYNDLLKVYSYDTGKIVYEYPIWIEKTKVNNKYQQTVFSDGTKLNTIGYHGIFNKDLNKFVSVDNQDEFKLGTTVVKLNDKTNKLEEVKVVSIKMINKKVNNYHVVSSRYYNIFANNILTTDGNVILSNLYGFDENIRWPEVRKQIMNSENTLYSYDDFKDTIPKSMYKGMRMEEAKVLANYGLSLDLFKFYLVTNQVNEELYMEPQKDNTNTYLWPVSTSDDKMKLLKEGEIYKLKAPKKKQGFVGWYCSGDNKMYMPNDTIEVQYGLHFEAIYKNK